MKKMFILLWVVTVTVLACNNSNSETPRASAAGNAAAIAVDSATNAASDTIRPSSDTTAAKHL
jgi:uncharacterized protein (UPF0333 family)